MSGESLEDPRYPSDCIEGHILYTVQGWGNGYELAEEVDTQDQSNVLWGFSNTMITMRDFPHDTYLAIHEFSTL